MHQFGTPKPIFLRFRSPAGSRSPSASTRIALPWPLRIFHDVGMVAAYELMVGVPAVRNLVREGKTRQLRNVVATHRADGMQTLENSLTEMVHEGLIDYDAAVDASLYPQDSPKPKRQAARIEGAA